MTSDCLRLAVYFGERDRLNGHLTSDVLLDLYEHHGLRGAILVRAAEGFGIKHQLRTQRLLTLSEDLPLVSVALDTPSRIEGVLPELRSLLGSGLVTLERARLVTATGASTGFPDDLRDATKLTLFLGRHERAGERSAYAWAVEVLRRHGVGGATVVLGVDGLTHGQRRRARFLSRNADVPVMVVAVGAGAAVAGAVAELSERLVDPLMTLERVRVCKRDGVKAAEPAWAADTDAQGLGIWQKLTVYAGGLPRAGKHPLHIELIHRLRLEGAAGATAVRGIWGYSGDDPPQGDRLLSVRRRTPVVLTLIDRPAVARRWWQVIDEHTEAAGLVTSEVVPAFHAVAPGMRSGGLQLARPGKEAGRTPVGYPPREDSSPS